MILKSQAELNGLILSHPIQLFSNEVIVELVPNIVIKESICSNILYKSLEITIEIENKSNETLLENYIINKLPNKIVKIIPQLIQSNKEIIICKDTTDMLFIKMKDLAPNEKVSINFIISRNIDCKYNHRWKFFDNSTTFKFNQEIMKSHEIRIHNGLFRRSICARNNCL